ncbi:hypothetical protein AYK59_05345 [Pseudomonas synxantha]|uniref:Uncharacterized protein n=1 Tax=Pseudomonas libanensis TaxID=75588 RepID=A0ABR5M1G3_9PSED|nr:hypothetical protein AYK59_05345 [Pseudomonas synxantha]KPG70921.1 hypothetical protein AEQ48_24200 [Pseudomonas libanensis]
MSSASLQGKLQRWVILSVVHQGVGVSGPDLAFLGELSLSDVRGRAIQNNCSELADRDFLPGTNTNVGGGLLPIAVGQ